MAYDPILGRTKLIAEAWDAGGLYQVGSFPNYGRWAEWNGKYRDTLRRFLKGDADLVWEMAQRIQGSPDLYAERSPSASINFITAHDGFTLADLFTFSHKHNEANGENNRDGANDNYSWNWGHEGPTTDPKTNALRRRLVKNAFAILLVSQGIPMILMGDEIGHSKHGNNNTYSHDNELNWLDWTLLEKNADLFRFVQSCIAFRQAHTILRRKAYLRHEEGVHAGCPEISWHGTEAWNPAWHSGSHALAFMLCSQPAADSANDDHIYVAMNMHWKDHFFELPRLPHQRHWHIFADTNRASPNDVRSPGQEPLLPNQRHIWIGARSVVVLVGR
jgi:glycogen operon protein